jgi:hypothetical protein
MAFASPQNNCHKIKPPLSPMEEHQNQYCLSSNHTQCPVFTEERQADDKKYHGIFANQAKPELRISSKVMILAGAGLILGIILIQQILTGRSFGIFRSNDAEGSAPTAWVQPTILIDQNVKPTTTPAPAEPTQTPMPIAEPPPPSFIETPMGIDKMFIVHRVLPGESIASLASTFKTTEDAIRSINYKLGTTLFVDKLLVLPFGRTNVSGVPALTVYLVEVDGLTLEQLAIDKSVDYGLLRELNALPKGYQLTRNQVIVLPPATAP